ncbi:hypothetical protein B0H10DRAFT_2441947 [Mycena sp. CBHHK59/15]|nr:hypothetical protein B0H10DRAFT_2441947 [Mycena sp. CBHHK59/15]
MRWFNIVRSQRRSMFCQKSNSESESTPRPLPESRVATTNAPKRRKLICAVPSYSDIFFQWSTRGFEWILFHFAACVHICTYHSLTR